MKINPILAVDSYKLGHMTMYPEGTSKIYCNFTARTTKRLQKEVPTGFYDGKVVVFGVSAMWQEIVENFQEEFFSKNIEEILEDFRLTIRPFIGDSSDTNLLKNVRKLHELGFLPLKLKSLPEGSVVPEGVPMITLTNTHPDFAWLPNYLETYISSQLWKLSTSATIARIYKKIFNHYAEFTGSPKEFTDWQGHDFSQRGMSGFVDAIRTGSGHLTSFLGSDSISSVKFIEKYYRGSGLKAASVPATEHSVMSLGSKEDEIGTFRRLFSLYPTGIVSVVSDTWDTFGGTINDKGFKVLDEHVGLIYGDSITLDRAVDILQGLVAKGFASSNIVLGIGSYTYQMVTRDTLGFAMKATYGVIDGTPVEIFKAPKDDSTKVSAKGLLRVDLVNGDFKLTDCCTEEQESGGELKRLFENGLWFNKPTFDEIRGRLNA